MIDIGTIRGYEVTKDGDSDEESRMLQIEFTREDDLQAVEQVGQVGEDANPHPGARVIVVDLGPSYRVAIATSDGITPTVLEGERELYSYDSGGNKLATLRILSDSNIEINGNTDFAVRFNELKTAFDQLQADHDDLVSKYNLHVHGGVLSGAANTAATLTTDSPSTANIDPAKVPNVKVAGV